MEIKSPHSAYKAIKRATAFFEKKVNNSKIKEEPSSRSEAQELEIGVTTVFGEIFWMKLNAKRNEGKTSTVYVRSSPSTMHLFLSAIVILMSGPFFYLAFTSGNPFVYFVSGFFILLGVASLIMPFIRIRSTKKALKAALTSYEKIDPESDDEKGTAVTSRINLS
ncbi:MAG: hypothetical protein FK733_16630 [Asgard group archaeon]|nr:hypothetical protein [Asgard group archaeon]